MSGQSHQKDKLEGASGAVRGAPPTESGWLSTYIGFGEIIDGNMCLKDAGRIVFDTWSALPDHYFGMKMDAFVVMSNHIHGIIVLNDHDVRADDHDVGAGFKPAPTKKRRHGLPEIVRGFKTFSSRYINESRATPPVGNTIAKIQTLYGERQRRHGRYDKCDEKTQNQKSDL